MADRTSSKWRQWKKNVNKTGNGRNGKRWILLWALAFLGVGGCQSPDMDIHFQDTSALIDDWLAYKAQMEDTTPFADGSETQYESDSGRNAADSPGDLAYLEDASSDRAGEAVSANAPKKDEWAIHKWNPPSEEPAIDDSQHGFYYLHLSDSAKVIYDEILTSLLTRKARKISTLSDEQVDLVFQCVLYDHPEIFYVSGYHLTQKTMDGQVIELSITGQYEYDEEETKARQIRIDAYVAEALGEMPQYEDEYEKVKYVFDYLILHTSYRLSAPDNQNICSVFITGESVCQGYAEAAQYLLHQLGMEASIVTGIVNGGGRHAWNLVKVNGEYYYMDVTWGDVDYRAVDQIPDENRLVPVNYDYFLVTTNQLEKSHDIDTLIDMPPCTAVKDNYYVREGLYFEDLDESRIAHAFARAYENGQSFVTLKSSSEEVFLQMKQYLLDENHVFEYINALESITYSQDDNMYTLCFWL